MPERIYQGVLRNSHIKIRGDDAALEYAFRECGIKPDTIIGLVQPDFKDMLLEWFYSGNWVVYDDGMEMDT